MDGWSKLTHGWVYLHIHRRVYTHPQTGVHTHPQTGPNILTFGSNILTFGPNILTFGPKQGQNSSLLDQNRVKIAHFWVKIAHFGPKQLTFGSKQLTFGPKGCHQARLCTKRVSKGCTAIKRVYSHQKGVPTVKGCPDSQKGVPTVKRVSRPWEKGPDHGKGCPDHGKNPVHVHVPMAPTHTVFGPRLVHPHGYMDQQPPPPLTSSMHSPRRCHPPESGLWPLIANCSIMASFRARKPLYFVVK